MLKHIKIGNFQIHANTELDFDSGMNVIAGSSDNGKSSIIRAIRWVVTNRPSGFAFHKHGTNEDTVVSLEFDDTTVGRCKGLKNSGGYKWQGKTFSALRTDVPPEIQRALNMGDINIQSQHDPYFLLQDSPGEVAKKLNVVAGLSIIGETIQYANAHVRSRKEEVGSLLQQISRTKEELSSTDWAEQYKEDVESLKSDMQHLATLQQSCTTLHNVISSLYASIEEYNRLSAIYKEHNSAVQEAKEEVAVYLKNKDNVVTLEGIIRKITQVEHVRAKADKIMAVSASYERVRDMVTHYRDTQTKLGELFTITKQLRDARDYAQKCKNDVQACTDAISAYKRDNPLCPVCGKPWEGK